MNNNGINKYIKTLILSFGVMILSERSVQAAEITAVNFMGDVIGQVISTGLVINADGENIGSITADSLIVDEGGQIIGGVVPQGIAIGNDNRLLGKVSGDGVVRNLTGKPLGKVLPNGLVVDGNYVVIGSILFPGLVYSATGEIVGRVTGAGTYIDLDGRVIGFISADGYAYRKTADKYSLDGRLMSAKMVVSLEGDFIGSIASSGKVIDFEGKEIGNVHANDYVYTAEGRIIGRVVRTQYAFDLRGRYIGVVTYNGIVKNGAEDVGRYRADGRIVNQDNVVIGYAVSIAATANDNNGNYLGRIMPKGLIAKGTEIVGVVGSKGYVYNKEGQKIGELTAAGPVFDALGRLIGQSMRNGTFISLGGNVAGRMRGRYAFDSNGVLVGGLSEQMLAVDGVNKSFGVANIDSQIINGTTKETISPFGYLLNEDNRVVGGSYDMGPIYGVEGLIYSYLDPNGAMYRMIADTALSANGNLVNKSGYVGSMLSSRYALSFKGNNLGIFAENNIILDEKGNLAYKIIPDGYVVQSDGQLEQNVMPIRGYAGNRMVAVSLNGDLLGYSNTEGKVIDLNGNQYGSILYANYVSDNNNSVSGYLLPFATIINDKCSQMGIMNGRGEIVNNRDVVIGRLLSNGQAVSDVGTYIGHTNFNGGLVDFDGNFIGTLNACRGVDYGNNALGCVDRRGIIINNDNQWQYGVITPEPVIDFENNIIGQILANGTISDSNNQILGALQPNGNVISKSKKTIGMAMRYKVAFDNNNNFLGMVQNSGQILNNKGEIVGQINYDGSVQYEGREVGYALYDWYVYDENFVVYGYITKDGTVLNMSGSKLGKSDRGFVLNKERQIVARGNRDYTIRDASFNTIGELQMDGNVLDYNNQNVGYLADGGIVRNGNGDEVAKAYALQYYVVTDAGRQPSEKPDWADYKKVQIQDAETPKISGSVSNLNRKIIGIALDPDGDILGNIYDDNRVYDDQGDMIGYRTPDGTIVDVNYNPIGVEEIKNISAGNMFVPAGTFGNGNAYGIGAKPSNLGPGGGYGQGERYDPARASALSQLHDARREGMSVGSIASKIKVSNFTGYEEDTWPNSNRSISSWRVDMSEMILEDKPIPAVLARSVYASEGLGSNIPITAIVERNIYSEEGRNIIIPAGSRVIGSLGGDNESSSGGNSGGAVKIGISWKRLIRPDGSQFTLGNAQTADAQGRAGAIGYLDQQLLKKYTEPLLTSAIENAAAYLIASGEGSSTTDGGTTTESSKSQAASDARESFIDQMDQVFEDIIEMKSNIRAVTYVPAGTRIIIFPNQDLWLNSEKRSQQAEEQGGFSDNGQGLIMKHPEGTSTGGRSGGSNVSYRGEYEEDIEPVSGGLVATDLDDSSRRHKKRTVPATIDQENVEMKRDEDVPSLL